MLRRPLTALTLVAVLVLPLAGCGAPPGLGDAGPDPADAGPDPADAGPDPADAGPDPADAGPDPADGGAAAFLQRPPGTDLRLASYNIWWNSIFEDPAAQERFARVVRAVGADVWALQEVWAPTADVGALFDGLLPLPNGGHWQAVYAGARVTVSRYPIVRHHWQTDPTCGTKASLDLIDLPDGRFGADLYLVNPGFTPFEGPEEDAARQCEADQISSWLRRATDPQGAVRLATGTPVVIAGDLNMVGSLTPLRTLLEGDIVDEARFGPDYAPDWDGSALTDAEPRHNGVGPETWTWRSDGSRWDPGRLDFILYSDSVLAVTGSFVLNTASLSEEALADAGLERLDVVLEELVGGGLAFDHVPVVADLDFP